LATHGSIVSIQALQAASVSIVLLLALAGLALVFQKSQRLVVVLAFAVSGVASLLAALAGVLCVARGSVETVTLLLGLPELPFTMRLDPLAGFFLVVVGLLALFVSIYSLGYVRGYLGQRPITSLAVFYALFLAGMFMVILANDALFFLVSWEVMAVASYFLVLFEDERVENRRAGFLYLVVAHVGAVAILLSFGIMAGLGTGFTGFAGYSFDAMRASTLPPAWGTAAFLLAFFGFAAKAGVIPLHVWLPEAHPVAPSNVSALMSGVMLKTAIYGIVRVSFDLLRDAPWWWGAIILVFGLLSAVLGVLYALMQNDLKRLLAYSSVENVGIVLVGVGLSMIFRSFDLHLLAALALTAGLYHALSHALFKGLLFMGAGAVLHATGERNMERLGGLIHRMPWTAALFLVGAVSISALPPFNGFVSEWLTFQAFLLSPNLPEPMMKLLIPMGAALLALTSALAAACFVKAFGVTFLGHWRGPALPHVHEADWAMRAGMLLAAVSCLALGVFPPLVIDWMDAVMQQLVGMKIGSPVAGLGWLWLTPVAAQRASYSGGIVFLGLVACIPAVYLLLHIRPGAIRRVPIWDCGFEKLTPRMQYTGTAFAMPLRRIFGFLFSIKERVKPRPYAGQSAYPARIGYSLRVRDRVWSWFYAPIGLASFAVARQVGRLQQGRIQSYLIYSFVTIIVLLVFLR
jgi:formate hydrogenlyase subunit 3/multisubunit Na+/H+ antiporter MnhD subunit